jgi:endo-1,3-1,4-beta-glycanase ExoK
LGYSLFKAYLISATPGNRPDLSMRGKELLHDGHVHQNQTKRGWGTTLARDWVRILRRAIHLFAACANVYRAACVPSSVDLSKWSDPQLWIKSDGYTHGKAWNMGFRADHALIYGSELSLRLDTTPCPVGCSNKPYAAGQLVSKARYRYGFYQVDMQASKGNGLLSGFDAYANSAPNRRQERDDYISVDVLGKDSRRLLLDYAGKGIEGGPFIVNLDFDASSAAHRYGFAWTAQSIEWFVDGRSVYKVNASRAHPIPKTASTIELNVKTAGDDGALLVPISYVAPVNAYFSSVSFSPPGIPPPGPAARPIPSVDLSAWNNASRWVRLDNVRFYGNSWRARQALAHGAELTITLDNAGCPRACTALPYASDGLHTKSPYGYGLYEIDMQSAPVSGLNTAFFTYIDSTGLDFGDEIDIEILSRNPRQMRTNFYNQGKEGVSHIVELGFDSSREMHHYGINWTPAFIQWIVDGRVVWTDSASEYALPTRPSKLYVNLWTAGKPGTWFGSFTYPGRPVHAYFANPRFTSLWAAGNPFARNP